MRKLLTTLCLVTAMTMTAAQTRTFTRHGLEYVLVLPSTSWRAVARVDVHEHFEFINGDDYSNGYLRLRKKLVAPGARIENIFAEDEKWELQRLSGYVVCSACKGTDFTGNLRGTMFSYEYIDGGSAMDGRVYYLQVDSRTLYVLHFTVASEKLQGLREQMDFIARSFRFKRHESIEPRGHSQLYFAVIEEGEYERIKNSRQESGCDNGRSFTRSLPQSSDALPQLSARRPQPSTEMESRIC